LNFHSFVFFVCASRGLPLFFFPFGTDGIFRSKWSAASGDIFHVKHNLKFVSSRGSCFLAASPFFSNNGLRQNLAKANSVACEPPSYFLDLQSLFSERRARSERSNKKTNPDFVISLVGENELTSGGKKRLAPRFTVTQN
jgi:hypothetical protein